MSQRQNKLLFFDIDGTLWDWKDTVPDSAREAIRRARANGCLTFLNSGRGRGYIRNPDLLSIGFDGIVSGDGTMIELPAPGHDTCSLRWRENRLCLFKQLSKEQARCLADLLDAHGARAILEGPDYLYIDREAFGDDPYINHVAEGMGEDLRTISDHRDNLSICKIACDLKLVHDREHFFRRMEDDFEALIHNRDVVEFVPKGYSKGTGLLEICHLLSRNPKDTVAFGDGANDLSMFREAGFSVAMGSGNPKIHGEADFVTTGLWEDGIALALSRLGLA